MSAAPMVELGPFQFRARCRRQAEALMSLYRQKKDQPGNTDCRPGILLTSVIWMVSPISAIAQHNARWFTNGGAGIKVETINRPRIRVLSWLAAPILLTTILGPLLAPIALGSPPNRAIIYAVVSAVTVLPLVVAAVVEPLLTGRDAKAFETRIDAFSADLARYRAGNPGSGLDLLRQLHALADSEDIIIGGVANTAELRDFFYMANGRVLDCGPEEDPVQCLRTIYIPIGRRGLGVEEQAAGKSR